MWAVASPGSPCQSVVAQRADLAHPNQSRRVQRSSRRMVTAERPGVPAASERIPGIARADLSCQPWAEQTPSIHSSGTRAESLNSLVIRRPRRHAIAQGQHIDMTVVHLTYVYLGRRRQRDGGIDSLQDDILMIVESNAAGGAELSAREIALTAGEIRQRLRYNRSSSRAVRRSWRTSRNADCSLASQAGAAALACSLRCCGLHRLSWPGRGTLTSSARQSASR